MLMNSVRSNVSHDFDNLQTTTVDRSAKKMNLLKAKQVQNFNGFAHMNQMG
jgi:hypothetical protein